MPELPEVETIRRDLVPVVVGRTITRAWISPSAPRLVQLMPPEEFARQIEGQRIADISRRGKYLLFGLDSGLTWAVHLRMTGRLMHRERACPEDPHLRATFGLDDGTWLCFVDMRKFGTMWLVDDATLVTAKMGPEPLDESFDPAAFRGVLKRRSAPIKAVIMDQSVLAGLGNIYADEALFAARINPRRAAGSLSRQAVQRLHAAIVEVLHEALGDRGSSFRDYVDGRGNEGSHHLKVKVFRRTDQPCYACGTPVRRVRLGGRSTHYCPRCQR
ncbi:MAG: bifunctional DNA-formamidopyrimidine glycosylase/DNA-(apurinic or apyrimidinic site) lyase [Dehalococcoidia bacterium]|nr:bifunctional DNA-formamidopyrimidine glycosylase/DNA-(apurinic or apyrimidinic site) lyase [Dehalococcoidia bacterium]